MSDCAKCNGSGEIVTCPEPMAGLAGHEREPCECTRRDTAPMACPLCHGSRTVAPHPATLGAVAGIDDPCPCTEAT